MRVIKPARRLQGDDVAVSATLIAGFSECSSSLSLAVSKLLQPLHSRLSRVTCDMRNVTRKLKIVQKESARRR